MKGNVKKIFAAILALTLVVSVAGCGKKTTGYNEDGIYELVWYQMDDTHPDTNAVYEKLSEYTREKIGVNVNFTPFGGAEYQEKMQLLFASGERIDLCFASTGTKFEANARQSAYLDMGKLLDTVGKPTKELLPEYALDCYKVGGIQYGIPVLKDWAFQPTFNGNTKYLEEIGMVEEFENATEISQIGDIIAELNKVHPGYYGILIRGNHNLFKFLDLETVTGSVIAGFTFDDYENVVNVMETDEAAELFKEMRKWYTNGWIKNDAATSTSDKELWALNNFLGGNSEWLPYHDVTTHAQSWANNLRKPRLSTTQVTMCGMAIPRTSGDPEKAMEFINLLYTDEYVRNTVAYGIEGKHWVTNEEGKMALPEGVENKAKTGFDSIVAYAGNRFILKVNEKHPADIWEKYQEFNEIAEKSPALGFTFDSQPVAGQIAAVQNAYNEFFPSLVVGAVDPETELPKFIDKLNNVGAKEIVDEVQAQYDAWKALK